MKKNYAVDAICVEVFGKISATVSHEIKNTLSIINENAGLLNDFAMMAGEDGGVPSAKVDDATTAIARQVARSNTIMLNLNRFSHSGDTPVSQANLKEILQLMVALSSRQAASKSVSVDIHCPAELTVTTSLLPFEALLFIALNNLYNVTGGGADLLLEAMVSGAETRIIITEKEHKNCKFDQYTPGEKEQILTEALKGSCKISPEALTLCIASDLQAI
jgi:C4-dicarboxylate-specific signal transduction histidine kinase